MSNRGCFVWEELMTTDIAAAAAFYGKVAGLKTEKAAFDPNYTTWKAGGRDMGGLMTLPDEARAGGTPPMWVSYIGTPDADATARQCEALGGKVAKGPWNIGDGGRIAILQDPQGAIFSIYANPKANGAPPAPQLGSASWHELVTTDIDAALDFYRQLFGWSLMSDMDMGPQGVYRMFGPERSKEAFGGMYVKPPQQPGPPAWLPYIKVANVKTATATAKSLGAKIMHGPAEVPGGGWISMGTDPQGVMFALHSTASKATAPKPASKTTAKAGARRITKKKSATSAKKKAAPKKKTSAPKKKTAKKAKRKAGGKK
jgi:predicted enzyme related to lactoylglutathione lyase